MSTKSIIIAGYYGFGNAGDELILYSLIQRFRKEDPDTPITVFSNSPDATEKMFNVQAVHRWLPWTWLAPLTYASRFVLGGGGLLQESTGRWNYAYYVSLLFLARLFGCRTEMVSVGVDPIRGRFNRVWTRWVLNYYVHDISVRDQTSQQSLVDAGVNSPVHVRRDPVFDLTTAPGTPQKGIAFALTPSLRRPTWAADIAKLCGRLQHHLKLPIHLVVFYPEQDRLFAQTIANKTAAVRGVKLWKNPKDLVDWIPQYQMVVGTRFHALVLAANHNIPFMGWGPHGKVATLCRDLDQPYSDTDAHWNEDDQFNRIVAVCQSTNKSVILASRIA